MNGVTPRRKVVCREPADSDCAFLEDRGHELYCRAKARLIWQPEKPRWCRQRVSTAQTHL